MKNLVYNAVKCLQCEETIVSRHVHDYVECKCSNKAMVDGGNSYSRYGAVDMTKIRKIDIYDDDDFETVRQYAVRGSRGVDGRSALTWIPLCEMTDSHLKAVVEYGGAEWHINLIKKEIKYRKNLMPKYKFNSGMGANVCNDCSRIISTGLHGKKLYCEECIPRHDVFRKSVRIKQQNDL